MSGQVMLFSSAAFLFMLLLMCCGSGGVVCAEEVKAVSQSNSVELFKKGETRVSKSATDVTLFRAHSLVDVNGLMVAFAEAHSNCGGSKSNIEIWSKSLRYEKDKLLSEIIKPNGEDQRTAQAAAIKKASESYCIQLSGPSAVVKDNKIYLLPSSRSYSRDREIVVGTVATSTDGSPNKITWDPPKSLKDTLKGNPPTGSSGDELRADNGRGIVMGGSTILFPLAFYNFDLGGNIKCTVIYSEDDGKSWNFPPKKIIDEDCLYATLLGWEGKLLMITTSSSSRTIKKVHVSADKGKTWAEDGESGPFLLVDILKRVYVAATSDAITATISGRNVTLLTQQKSIPWRGTSELRVQDHLLMTDNKRITSVGPISLGTDTYSGCKLLHKEENGGLFALCNEGSWHSPKSTVLFSLTEQLERIKFVLKSWEITDGKFSKICVSATKEARCSTAPTSGLIGFLSNTGDSTHWADEYFGVNATVSGGTKVENGFKISVSRAFIQWEIGGQEQNQLYSFADRGLTLVATVTIHDIPTSDTPLMSVGLESKVVGLWYGKENHWKGLSGEEENTSWEKGKLYQVAITLLKGAGSVYIDGKRLGGLEPNFQPNKVDRAQGSRGVSHGIKEEVGHICFGNCPFMHNDYWNNAGSSFTVTNVFLYNRVLNDTELLPPPPAPPQQQQQQQQQGQSQSTAEETGEATITGNPTVEERTVKPPQQEQEQSQSTAKGTGEATITGNSTDEERSNTPPAGKNSSVHESLSSLFQLFAVLVFLGSATLL